MILLYSILEIVSNVSVFAGIYSYQVYEVLSILIISTFFHYTRKYNLISLMENVLSWFGKYSLELYVMHMVLFGFIKIIMYDYLLLHQSITNDRYAVLLVLSIAIIICKPMHELTSKISNMIIK